MRPHSGARLMIVVINVHGSRVETVGQVVCFKEDTPMRSIAASRSCSATAFSLANGPGAQHPDRLWSIRLGHLRILPGSGARAVRCLAWARSETAFSTGFIFAVINVSIPLATAFQQVYRRVPSFSLLLRSLTLTGIDRVYECGVSSSDCATCWDLFRGPARRPHCLRFASWFHQEH